MLRITADGCEVAGLGVTIHGAVGISFETSEEARLLCGVLLEAAATAHASTGPGDAYLRARGWDPEEFHRVGGVEQMRLYDMLSTEALFWSNYRTVSPSRLPLVFERFADAEPGSFDELLVAMVGLAMDAEPEVTGLEGLAVIAPPLTNGWAESRICCAEERAILAMSPELPLPSVIETGEVEVPGWLLCVFGDARELARVAESMAERRLTVESLH